VYRIGPDRLYIALGQPFNVPSQEKADLYFEIGGIIRMNRDGSGREVFATRVRYSVDMDFNPADGTRWFTDNQVDGMGDTIPPDKINKASRRGVSCRPGVGTGKRLQRRTGSCDLENAFWEGRLAAAQPVLGGAMSSCLAVAYAALCGGGDLLAADAAAGRQKAKQCATCHGIDGIARVPIAPHWAGQSPVYLETQLKVFRFRKSEHEIMSVVAEGLRDEDIADLAAWYSSIEITVTLSL